MIRTAVIALLGAAALCGCASGPPAATAPHLTGQTAPPTPAQAQARGLEFLLTHQNADGSWSSFETARPNEVYLGTVASHRAFRDATTALCAMALLEPSRHDDRAWKALDRGMEHLLTAEPTARATGDTFYDTWTHTFMTQALSMLHRDERFADRRPRLATVIRREIDTLARRQGADGGWGYYDFGYALKTPSGDESTSFNTASALLAFHEASLAGFDVDSAVIADAIRCLERLRLPSGAFVYGTYAQMNPGALYNHVKGSLGRSQPCNLALWTYQRNITRDDLRTGLENLRQQHHFIWIGRGRPYPHEAWYFTAGYYFLYGHYYASRVIDQLPEEQQGDYRRWLADAIAQLQDPDGSWFDFPFYGYHRFYGTAFALLTLQHCGATDAEPIASADR